MHHKFPRGQHGTRELSILGEERLGGGIGPPWWFFCGRLQRLAKCDGSKKKEEKIRKEKTSKDNGREGGALTTMSLSTRPFVTPVSMYMRKKGARDNAMQPLSQVERVRSCGMSVWLTWKRLVEVLATQRSTLNVHVLSRMMHPDCQRTRFLGRVEFAKPRRTRVAGRSVSECISDTNHGPPPQLCHKGHRGTGAQGA